MAKRVAVTIAGAVSLGSYEAGVIYELLEAFRTHNQEVDAKKRAGEKIYIDVLTGASAGGMTAAMLAQALMFNGGSLGGDDDIAEFTNPLYRAWVKRIDISELVKLRPKERPWHSLLSSDLITEIGQEMLVETMKPEQPQSGPHPAVECEISGRPLPIDLGLAVTNLTGVDYMLPIQGSKEGGFNYTTSVDERLYSVSKDGLSHVYRNGTVKSATWEQLRDVAVSCGAFPAAFRCQPLSAECEAYGINSAASPNTVAPGTTFVDWGNVDPKDMVYCDGGVLQNQPLGIAKNFVDTRVSNAEESGNTEAYKIADERLYVFVSPHAVKTSVANKLKAPKITIVRELIAVIRTYVRQAMFHDWITAEGINSKIRVLDERAFQLAEALKKQELDSNLLAEAADALNKLLLNGRQSQTIARLRHQYEHEYKDLQQERGKDVAEAFIAGLATLETAAELGGRDTMKIVAVIADGRNELAGAGISAFAGFFSREYREHDYWVGRVKTRVYLQRADVKRILGVSHWPRECYWGGPNIEQVKAVLKNPTAITELPLSFGNMIRPGLASLSYMLWIRRSLWLLAAVVVGFALLLVIVTAVVAAVFVLLVTGWSRGMLFR